MPVSRGNSQEDKVINKVKIDGHHWARKHYLSLVQSYNLAPYFSEHKDSFEYFYNQTWTYLAQLLRESTDYLLKILEIRTPLLFSSEMNVNGEKSDLILNLCKAAGATTYLSGPFGRDYLDMAVFNAAGVDIIFQDYNHPVYIQYHGDFVPYMSIVDLIFNHGKDSLGVLLGKDQDNTGNISGQAVSGIDL